MNGCGDWDGVVPPIATPPEFQRSGIRVSVHLYTQGQPVVILDVENTYQKGDMYCVRQNPNGTIYKFPLQHIFRVTEEQ